jgi:hypothetical protein
LPAQPVAPYPYQDFDPTKEFVERITALAARRWATEGAAARALVAPPPPSDVGPVAVVVDNQSGEPTAVRADPARARSVNPEPLVALHVPGHVESVIGPSTSRTYRIEGAQWDRVVRVAEADARALMARGDWACLNHEVALRCAGSRGGLVSGDLVIGAEAERALVAKANSGTVSRKELTW